MKLRRGTFKRLHSKKYDKDYFLDTSDHYMHKIHAYSRKIKYNRTLWYEEQRCWLIFDIRY